MQGYVEKKNAQKPCRKFDSAALAYPIDMANKTPFKTTFEVVETIKPIYTGNGIAVDRNGGLLATALSEDALLTDLDTGRQLAKIEGVGIPLFKILKLTVEIGWRTYLNLDLLIYPDSFRQS